MKKNCTGANVRDTRDILVAVAEQEDGFLSNKNDDRRVSIIFSRFLFSKFSCLLACMKDQMPNIYLLLM